MNIQNLLPVCDNYDDGVHCQGNLIPVAVKPNNTYTSSGGGMAGFNIEWMCTACKRMVKP